MDENDDKAGSNSETSSQRACNAQLDREIKEQLAREFDDGTDQARARSNCWAASQSDLRSSSKRVKGAPSDTKPTPKKASNKVAKMGKVNGEKMLNVDDDYSDDEYSDNENMGFVPKVTPKPKSKTPYIPLDQRLIKPARPPSASQRLYHTEAYRPYSASRSNTGTPVTEPFTSFKQYNHYTLFSDPTITKENIKTKVPNQALG